MAFSVSQWLASFVLDAVIKSSLMIFIFVYVVFVPIDGAFPLIFASVCISIFHFICLFVGYSVVGVFEEVRTAFSARSKFWLGLLFANVLFGILLNVSMAIAFETRTIASFLELSSITLVFIVTNLIPIFLIASCVCIFRSAMRLLSFFRATAV